MRNICFLFFLATILNINAQSVIQNGSKLPAVGTTFPVSTATLSPTTSPGSSGANQVWDFSSLSFQGGFQGKIIRPATAPMGSSYPTSNFALSIGLPGLPPTYYSFFKSASDKMEVLAWLVDPFGGGSVFTPDPRTILKFPFNYQESVIDTWQQTGQSPQSVNITYDGYGNLKLPAVTYTNVVRIKDDYGNNQVNYSWFILDPLMIVALYDSSAQQFYHLGISQNVTSISEKDKSAIQLNVYPNPATDYVVISRIPRGADVRITDLGGKEVYKSTNVPGELKINTTGLIKGMYLIQVTDKGRVSGDKFFINK